MKQVAWELLSQEEPVKWILHTLGNHGPYLLGRTSHVDVLQNRKALLEDYLDVDLSFSDSVLDSCLCPTATNHCWFPTGR